jgi:hypothetical protein
MAFSERALGSNIFGYAHALMQYTNNTKGVADQSVNDNV